MITYRMADVSDASSVQGLLCAVDKTFPIPLSEKEDLSVLTQKFLEKGFVYMAADDETPVGMIGFYANNTDTRSAYISVLGILPTHQRRGIAKRMLSDSLALCKEKGMRSCFLYTHKTNVGAIALYNSFGFIAEEDINRPHDIKFVKEL